MQPGYRRTTRATRASELSEGLRTALSRGGHTLTEDTEALHTRSVRLEKPGFFARLLGSADPDEEHETALVLGESALRVAVSGQARGNTGFVLPYASLTLASEPRLAALAGVDAGPSITLTSPMLGGGEHGVGTYSVFFGPEPAAPEFVARLRERLPR